MVPLDAAPALSAVLAAAWHDMVVAGEEATPRRRAEDVAHKRRAGEARPQGYRDLSVVFPRRRTVRLEVSGLRLWGSEEDRGTVRRAHAVRGHLRTLSGGRKPSERARAAAGEFGIVLPEGCTFVRPHVRGRGEGAGGEEQAPPARVVARRLRTVAALLAVGDHSSKAG